MLHRAIAGSVMLIRANRRRNYRSFDNSLLPEINLRRMLLTTGVSSVEIVQREIGDRKSTNMIVT